MRRARIFMQGTQAGILEEGEDRKYRFSYDLDYQGPPVSLSMPTSQKIYDFDSFPPFLDGLLPEGFQLNALLKQHKIDRRDYFTQLVIVGHDLVGAITVEEIT